MCVLAAWIPNFSQHEALSPNFEALPTSLSPNSSAHSQNTVFQNPTIITTLSTEALPGRLR